MEIETFTLGPFETEVEAAAALNKLEFALLWSSLDLGIGIQYARSRGTVTLLAEPQRIPESGPMAYIRDLKGWEATDGHYEAEHAIARPDNKRLIRWEMGHATITVGVDPQRLLASLEHVLVLPGLTQLVAYDKLKLGIELYAGHRFELSENAQFISLITALEALLPDVPIAQAMMPILDRALDVVRTARDRQQRDVADWAEADRLLSRMAKLKDEAIGTSMRQFAASAIARHPALGDAEVVSRSLRAAYSARSRLLHDGIFDNDVTKQHLTILRTFVPSLLRALFEETSARSM